jgi:hypothetical protein
LREKLDRQKENLEKRFEGVETNEEFKKDENEDNDNITRELPIDNVKLMPDK